MKKIISILWITIALFSISLIELTYADGPLQPLSVGGTAIYHYDTTDPVMTPQNYVERQSEFRGVWVATVYNLNMPLHTSQTQYKAAYDDLLDRAEANNLNAILFQTRPRNDAFYQSSYAPWSRYLTGTEGNDPGWDVMEYMVTEAHARGIEFHAWMNPYRVTTTGGDKMTLLNALAPNNFARQNPDLVIADNDGKLILNPGEPAVVDYIKNVVGEIMDLYDVDGIHFDDYFYPYAGLTSDSATYDKYKLPGESLGDFRRRSVNNAISGVKSVVDEHNTTDSTDIRFGVSPIGLWKVGAPDGANVAPGSSQSYYGQYADSKKWVDEGWVHYINPQIYWNFNHSLAPYADVVDWWAETVRGTGVDLIIGHGIYRTEYPTAEFYEQIKYNQKHPEIKGSMLYSASYLNTTHMAYVRNNAWTTKPLNTWATSNVDAPTYSLNGTLSGSVYRSDVEVTLSSTHDVYYHLGDGIWNLYSVPFTVTEQGTHTVYYKAVDSMDQESLVQAFNFEIEKINSDIPTIHVTGDMIGSDYLLGSSVSITSSEHTIWVAINKGSVGEWMLYSEPIILDELGTYYIRSKTIDAEGIESAESTRSIKVVDEIYPDPTISIEGVGIDPYYQNVEITLLSDAPSISYRINDGVWTTYTTPFTIDTEGEYTILYRNDDSVQNIVSKDIIIDQTPPSDPVITITGNQEGIYYIEETVIELSPIDIDDSTMYRLHNGSTWTSWRLYDDPIILALNATYKIEYYAQDKALNTSEVIGEFIRLAIPPSENNRFVIRNGEYVNYYQTDIPVELPTTYTEKEAEIRAVWVATVANIDIGLHESETQYKNDIINMLNRLEELNFNLIFFQTRPMNDAFYESDYAPWSRYVTGAEGVDPGWDIFQFIIDEAHHRGIEVHAWLNPYRVSNGTQDKATQLALLHDDNFAKQNPDLVIQDLNGSLILNPGEPQVRIYITSVINELMSKYNVDGVHFDDYFYSYSGTAHSEDDDTYQRTKLTNETKDDWRRRNVDTLIKNLSLTINNWNNNQSKHVKFGISPFGIWQSGGDHGSNTSTSTLQSYYGQYADTRKWVIEGWLDYIMPQLYWEFDHSLAPFADLVDWWAELCETYDVDLIIGQGFYRYTNNSWSDPNEMTEQIRYMSQYDSIIGSSIFSYKTLNSSNTNVVQALDRMQNIYWTEYPSFPWESDVVKTPDPVEIPNANLVGTIISGSKYEDSITVSLTSDHDVYYQINNGDWTLYSSNITINEPGTYTVQFKAIDDLGNESIVSSVTFEIIKTTCEDGYEYINGSCIPIEVEPSPPKSGCFSTLGSGNVIFTTFALVLGTTLLFILRRKKVI
ncbi:MAG: family 10 glycosylhydrolase [Tenericutes bacterium]|nr:family 10 glycosylhydrolase [Mycoplasmatota bacterium]